MSDNVVPPTKPHCARHGFLRALLYTPAVIMLGGLAALATFPDLARYASPLIDQIQTSGMASKCPTQCQRSSQDVDVTALASMHTGSCCEANNQLALRLAAIKQNAGNAFSCCEDDGVCPVSTQTGTDGALAMVITEDATAGTPADATVVENAVETDAASN